MSGHTTIDGPTEIVDLDKTEQNKAHVAAFLTDVFRNGNHHNIERYVSEDTFVQHSPQIADGISGLNAYLRRLTDHGNNVDYQTVHNVIGSGNFVAALSAVNLAGTDLAVIDLFRLESGRIVEHWDIAEQIQPRDAWVNTDKFLTSSNLAKSWGTGHRADAARVSPTRKCPRGRAACPAISHAHAAVRGARY